MRLVVKRAPIKIPSSKEEASEFLGKTGVLLRKIKAAEDEADNRISEIKSSLAMRTFRSREELSDIVDGLCAYAQANRDDLTQKGKTKTIKLVTGAILWRLTPPAVRVIKEAEKVIRWLKRNKLKRFVRVREEIDRRAMLRELEIAATIPGIEIERDEEFVVKPDMIETEEPSLVRELTTFESKPR